MMTLRIFGIIIFQTVVFGQAGVFGATGKIRSDETEILEASESRYSSEGEYPDRDYGNPNGGITRKDFDLPITFKAPHYRALDYWQNEHDYLNRRTFFEDFSQGPHSKTTPFPHFYQFMTSIFGGRDEIGPESPPSNPYNRHRATPPYSFPPPYGFHPTEPNYIPSPKPIRASIIKLETITSSPIYSSFDYETTSNYYPHGGSVLNVYKENSKPPQSVGYHPEPPLRKIPPFKPLPVLPKPEIIPPTTTNPIYSEYFNNNTGNTFEYKVTDYKYPESVQDKLPHLNPGEVEIPYVSERPAPQIFDPYHKETSRERQFGYTSDNFPPPRPRKTTNVLKLIDVSTLNSAGMNPEGRKPDVTTVRSFPGAVEKVKRPAFKYVKKLTAQLDKHSVERVTNLTVEGFAKAGNDGLNLPKNVNYFKVRDLINYEMNKRENLSHDGSHNSSSTRSVNLNDEFSLDAKILKDTNWDGLTVPPAFTTTELPETTTLLVQRFEPKPKTTTEAAFWELVETRTTALPNGSEEATEEVTATEQIIPTTTEVPFWYTATPEATESESVTPRISVGAVDKFSEIRDPVKPVTEKPETVDSTTSSESTTLKRRYSRRPKVVNFTPYPTPEELQRRLTSRNHFPKRSKPNITIAFGNKNVLKHRQSLGKEEFMKFSEEDVRKRRKIGKRRQVYKRLRLSTSERPVKDI